MGRKSGAVPLRGAGAGSPFNTMWPVSRPTCLPSFMLIRLTVWPQYTNVTDKTERQTGQRSDSIGRTVLQTVAQKRTVQDRTGQEKSQNGYISPICGETPTEEIYIKNCVVGDVLDVVTCAKFQNETFRGYHSTGGRFFDYWFLNRPHNSAVYDYIKHESQTTRNVCVSVCFSVRGCMPTLLHGPGCNLGNDRGCPPSCALLGGFAIGARDRWYGNIAPNAKCQRVLVLALCAVYCCRSRLAHSSVALFTVY